MNLYDFNEFVNEAEVKRNKVIASNGEECAALIKYCNKNGELASAMDNLIKAHHFVEEVEDYTQKLSAFKFQSAVRESDLPNCKVLLYKSRKAAMNDLDEFFKEPAREMQYNFYRDAVQKKENPKVCDFILLSERPAKDLSL